MRFNFVDVIAGVYVFYGMLRGAKRGLATELPKVIGVAVFFVTGSGLYHWTGVAMAQVRGTLRQASGILGILGALIGSYFLVRQIRGGLQRWAERKFPTSGAQKLGGGIAGGVRSLLLACCAILFLSGLPIGFLAGPFREGSVMGRTLNKFIAPAQHKAHDR